MRVRRRGINPTFWLFALGVLALFVGLLIPLKLLASVGAFVVLVYVVTWIVWVIFNR